MAHPYLSNSPSAIPEFLSGGGDMGQRIREYDWSNTLLGGVALWPQSLRSAISICLNSNFPIAIYWGKDLTLLYNDAWSPIPGTKHPWALGKPAAEVWPEIWDAIEPQFKKAFNGEPGGSKDALLPMHRHGYTEECYFDFTFTPIYGEGGKVEGVFNAVIETTKTILNERQLKTLRDLGDLDRTAKNVDDIFNAAGKALEKNNQDFPFGIIYKIVPESSKAIPVSYIGLRKDQTVFPSVIDLTEPTEGTSNFFQAYTLHQVVISENNHRRANLPKGGWDKEATQFLHLPIFNQNRKIPVAILSAALNPYRQFDASYAQFAQLIADQVSTEVTNMLAYEEEKKRAEALAEIDKAKTAFFTNISHEFRTPLTLILGTLEEALRDTAPSDKNAERLSVTHRNALRMLRLVNNLLDFSKLEAGREKAQFQLTDIAALTENLAANFRSAIENAGLAFTVHCTPVQQPVYIDQEMWEKIVLNLLSNAFKYTLKGGISLSLDSSGDSVVLRVKDTGVGIPAAELPNMFQRFHRVQNDTGRTFEGTGIGLSLVKELVQLHGGGVSVESQEGTGSEFTVTLPVGKDHLPANQIVATITTSNEALADAFLEEVSALITTSVPKNTEEAKTGAATVLVVDDNPDMRQYIENLLQSNFNIITAVDGKDALQKLEHHPVDLVVSDVMMPVLDGVALLKAIKEAPQTAMLPVILVSARAGEEAKLEGIAIGADDYLVKPFSSKELLARVHSQIALNKKRNRALQEIYHLFDEVPFAVVVLKGSDLAIEYINQYSLNIWQRSKEAVLHKLLFEARPDLRSSTEAIHKEVYRTGKRFRATEIPITFATGGKTETRYFNAIIDPMFNEHGEMIGQLATSIEITEEVMARRKVEESEKRFSNVLLQSPMAIAI